MAVCLVCGKFEEVDLKKAMGSGWVFMRCPECHRGTPLDIIMAHLTKTITEQYLDGFCPRHWFKDSGICGYCKIKREGITEDVS